MTPGVTITLYTLAALVMLLAVRLLSALALADSGHQHSPDQARPVDLTKPLVVYAQWLFIVVNVSGVPWPPSLAYPMQALAWFWSSASSNSLGLDCVLPRHAALPLAPQRVVFGLLMPLAILAVLMCIEALLLLRKRGNGQRGNPAASMGDRCLSLFLCISFLFLPTWAHTVFSLFACVPLDSPASPPYTAEAVGAYWAEDMSQACFAAGGYHKSWALGLGIPLMLLFCFALPAGLFAFIYISNMRGLLNERIFRRHYGFLYRTWRDGVRWWEAVVVLQTIVLVMIGSFGFALGPYYQSLVITAALVIILVLLLSVKPHYSTPAGVVTLQSVGVLFTTAFSALTFMQYRNIVPAPGYTMAMGVFVLLLNVVFVLSTLWKLLRVVEWAAAGRCCRSVCAWRFFARICSCRGIFHPRQLRLPVADLFVIPRRPAGTLGACCSKWELHAAVDKSVKPQVQEVDSEAGQLPCPTLAQSAANSSVSV